MRVCVVYDCLFPWTIGGAERWYRNLAEALVAGGHEVTYLTRRQWVAGQEPRIPGVRVIAVSRAEPLYGVDGKRRVGPPLRFGAGVLRHLSRNRDRYDVVHTASFPYFSVLAAAAARRHTYRIVVDWHEVWSAGYWRSYLGPIGGAAGGWVQRRCMHVPQSAFCFSDLACGRLEREGVRGSVVILTGEYAGDRTPPPPGPADDLVVFAGRLIAEKRAMLVVDAIATARSRGVPVTGLIFGDGPERAAVLDRIRALGLDGVVKAPGFVPADEVSQALDRALCLLHPSSREGYGLVVVEAAAHGTPSILVAGEDNAATELIDMGRNGIVVAEPDAESLADAIKAVRDAGPGLRARTGAWFTSNTDRLSLDRSLRTVLETYRTTP